MVSRLRLIVTMPLLSLHGFILCRRTNLPLLYVCLCKYVCMYVCTYVPTYLPTYVRMYVCTCNYKISLSVSQRTQSISTLKTNWLMMFSKIICIFCHRLKHINTLRVQIHSFLMLQKLGRIAVNVVRVKGNSVSSHSSLLTVN
jgi:hypothetical protein